MLPWASQTIIWCSKATQSCTCYLYIMLLALQPHYCHFCGVVAVSNFAQAALTQLGHGNDSSRATCPTSLVCLLST